MIRKSKEKLLDAKDELGYLPEEAEFQRLIKHYDSYSWEHRNKLLRGYFESKSVVELVEAKLKAKGKPKLELLTKQEKGAHTMWVFKKVKKLIVRLKFLRYTLDDGLTQVEAHQKLLPKYGSKKEAQDGGQSNVAKMTHSNVFKQKHPEKVNKRKSI